ncbi:MULTISPECIES: rod shape-determining protein MreD [unclassified Thioalkalivibrio]|uniref:rod shape-determining protein MreD n=1 Tax=unclassified Thioalkalivibrio TaxID=2621013 RepID=UPI00036AE80D|nr:MULTISPECIES: rod shape-determining protein MreD [unclassified Thioalkalivibrio]
MNRALGIPWLIALTLVVALALSIVPIPDALPPARPEWLLLALVYWIMAFPQRFGVLTAFIMGLLLDALYGQLLGQNAIALAVVAYIVLQIHPRLRVYPVWQQAIVVAVLTALYKLLALWPQGAIGLPPGSAWYWAPVATSALVWPLIFVLLRDMRRRWLLHLS